MTATSKAAATSKRLSIIVQFFNRRRNVKPVADALKLLHGVEIIVCDDGSIDGSHQEWLKHLTGSDEILIRSNDVHEMRSYDRAASIAGGKVICFLQDDDIPPNTADWIETALTLFAKYQRLGILGGYKAHEFGSDSATGGSSARVQKRLERPGFLEPELGIPFMFVQTINLAPMFIRKETYREVGIDLRFSKAGESGILFDQEACLHAWLKGWHVGLYEAAFTRRVGGRGTLIFSKESRERNFAANLGLLSQGYSGRFTAIKEQADGLNEALLRRRDSGPEAVAAAEGGKEKATRLSRRYLLSMAHRRLRRRFGTIARSVLIKLKPRIGPKPDLVRRVEALKKQRAGKAHVYRDAPKLSFVVCSFNDGTTAKSIVEQLRATAADELVVFRGGPVDRSDRSWARQLTRPNDFLIRSRSIQGTHGLRRVMSFARGDFVCVLQDDEGRTNTAVCTSQALSLFERYPRLGILGAHQGYVSVRGERSEATDVLAIYGCRTESSCQQTIAQIPFTDRGSGVRFMFVEGVSTSPIFYRRDVIIGLGDLDPGFCRGEDWSQLASHEICLGAWIAGWHVGLFDHAVCKGNGRARSTMVLERTERTGDGEVNSLHLAPEYAQRIRRLSSRIADLNATLRG